MQHVNGGKTSWRRWAAGVVGLAVVLAVGQALLGGSARAADPPYDIPTPTPTPTPTPRPTQTVTPTSTPFQSSPVVTPPSSPRRIDPFPLVRTAGSFTTNRTRFTRISVKAPVGTIVKGICTHKRCKRVRRAVPRSGTVRLKPLQRSYPPGTTITIRVTAPARIGKYVEIRTRRAKPPVRRDRCLVPGRTKPVACGGA